MSSPKKNKTEKRLETLAVKTKSQKEAFLEQLPKYPIVQVACEKSGVGRSTYYAWRKEDKEFAKLADEAVKSGTLFINDMAESKLIQNIQSGNNTAIIFWLKNHHKEYCDRVRHEHEFIEEELTSEQKISIAKALFNAGRLTSLGRNIMIKKAGGTPPPIDSEDDERMRETVEEAERRIEASEKEISEKKSEKKDGDTGAEEKMFKIPSQIKKVAPPPTPPVERPYIRTKDRKGVNINSMEYKNYLRRLEGK